MKRLLTNCALSLAVLLLASCKSCGDGSARLVAELVTTVGEVQRSERSGWAHASRGSTFELGDALRTGAVSRAELFLVPSGGLRVEADTIVRFEQSPPNAKSTRRLRLDAGMVEVDARTGTIEILTQVGATQVPRGSRVRVRSQSSHVRFEVVVGHITLERDGQQRTATAGQSFTLEVGAPILEPPSVAPQAATPTAAVQPLVTTPAAGNDTTQRIRFEAPLPSFELSIIAGESSTVHDPSLPLDVHLQHAGCADASGIEFSRADGRGGIQWFRGSGGAIARLTAGYYRYRVHCLGAGAIPSASVAAEGHLRVVHDSGTQQLPSVVPSVAILLDGRRYAIHFQNQPPRILVEWPHAPSATSYSLEMRGEQGLHISERAPQASVNLPSGRVAEGAYRLWMEAGASHSPESTLHIVFDESARIASLTEPSEGGFAAGAKVRVAGAALHGAHVEVAGQTLPLLAQGRFNTLADVPRNAALAVRVQHPATGVHYYLRHAAGRAP